MNTVIDIVKSDMGYFATAFLCILVGFGAGCGITEALFRWEGKNDEKDIHKGTTVAGKLKDSKNGRTEG